MEKSLYSNEQKKLRSLLKQIRRGAGLRKGTWL